MNADVMNEIYKRKPARDFLRLYPSDRWKEIIPDIFEIGVLNLKNSFGTLKFSKQDLKEVLTDLRNYKEENINEEEDEEENDSRKFNQRNNSQNIKENNDEEYNNDEESEEYNEQQGDIIINNNNQSNNNNNEKKNEEANKTSSKAEVFIPDMNKINRVNYNRPKKYYNSNYDQIREKNIENKRNINYTESKIKYQIMNDKMNMKMKKRKVSNSDSNDNDGSFSFNKNKSGEEKNYNKNYVINFDKKLNPQRPIQIKNNIYQNFDEDENISSKYNEEQIFNNMNNEYKINQGQQLKSYKLKGLNFNNYNKI